MCSRATTKSAFNTKVAKADTASLNQQATWVSAFKTNYRLASSSFWLLRRSDVFCDPMRAVDDEKLWNLLEAAKLYRHEHPECYGLDFRIDVVCVVGRVLDSGSYKLEHYENPFWKRIQEGKPWRTHYRRMRQGHYGYYRVGR